MRNVELNRNLILASDSYKYSHHLQLPPGTTHINSYIESRGGRFGSNLFFGLQAYIKTKLMQPITAHDVQEAEEIVQAHGLPFDRSGWSRVVQTHGGQLPVVIEAVPEGTVLSTNNVLVQIRNTDPLLPHLTSFLETSMLRAVWYMTTVATLSWHAKQMILAALEKSSDDPQSQINFKLHDFGARGVSSGESAALGGLAHLVNFQGTDTVEALVAARRLYGAGMAGFSIPAMEHSTVTSWGRDGEADSFGNMMEQFARPGAILAAVSDSYDLWNAVSHIWGEQLRDQVIQSGATVVIRPDSGDPLTVPIRVIELLGEKFGFTVNRKGYKVLPSCVRVIQGDGITIDSIPLILNNLLAAGWSADNLAFGMGGGLGQKVDRDTMRFAQKANSMQIGGVWRDVYKDPITDPGKTSKRGVLSLVRSNGIGSSRWSTIRRSELPYGARDQLRTVFSNGELLVDETLDQIRARSLQL
jgi:nicotinamide phosphoribosyltransferase